MVGLKRYILLCVWGLSFLPLLAQNEETSPYQYEIEPAASFVPFTLFWEPGISYSMYFPVLGSWELASHTNLHFRLNQWFGPTVYHDIEMKYDLYGGQKFGLGRRLFGKKWRHSLYFLAGAQYYAAKGAFLSPDQEWLERRLSQLLPEGGFMYRLQTTHFKKRQVNFKCYIPVFPHTIEDNFLNIIVEFGITLGRTYRAR